MPTIHAEPLERFAYSLLAAGGLTEDEAAIVARSLVGSNLRGYESHGVMRIPYYLDTVTKGEAKSGAELTILSETPAAVVADANWGIGQVQAVRLLEKLFEKAGATGVAVGSMRQSCHIGRLGEYCEMAAANNLVLMAMVNSHGAVHRVAPPGGKESRLATNPISFGIPCGDRPIIVDFSTSATAEGKVRVKHIAGEKCPDGWLIDSEGQPTNDPAVLYGEPRGCIVPMGGPQAYKGFGLSLIVEIFCGALSGGLVSREKPESQIGNCVYMQVLNPALFGGAEHFAKEVGVLDQFVRSCPTAAGVEKIILPGDPERTVLAKRTAEGLPFDPQNWAALVKLAQTLGVAAPELSA